MNNAWIMKRIALFIGILFLAFPAFSQAVEKVLTFEDVIRLAKDQSPQAMMARHRYRASYWQYRTHLAKFRPNLSLSSNPLELNRSIEKITLEDGSEAFRERKIFNTQGSLSLSQNIGLTGGSIFIQSDLQRIGVPGVDSSYTYLSTPVSIGFRQPFMNFNELIWERRIEPLQYEEAKKSYVNALEAVSIRAVELFFDLALAQLNVAIANVNYSNTDTLYKIAQGRYNIGTIPENELLQMELSHLNAGTQLNEATIDLQMKKFRLRSFLGYNETVELSLIMPTSVPPLTIEYTQALEQAKANNPQIIDMELQLLEARKSVAQAKAEKGLNGTLFASYGLTQQAANVSQVYRDPQDQQRIQVGIDLPILDWGLGRGRYKMAQSNQELVKTTVEQAQIDFEQNVFLQIMRFNMQDDQLLIAAKADTIAQLRYDLTKQRFLIGKIDVLDLNIALTEKDVAKRGYLETMRNYWNYFYTVRQLTMFDFLKNQPIGEDMDALLN
jgi:outer membrane protein TolC